MSFYSRDCQLRCLRGQVGTGGREAPVNWEACALSGKSQAVRRCSAARCFLFQEKQERDFYIKHSKFFNTCDLDFVFFMLSVGLI